MLTLTQKITVANVEQHHTRPLQIWEIQKPVFHINIQCRQLVKQRLKTQRITAAVLIRPLGLDIKEVLGGRFTYAAADQSRPIESCPWI